MLCGFIWALVDLGVGHGGAAWLAPLTWVVAVFAGLTMVSNVPFWSFKEVNWRKRVPLWVILASVLGDFARRLEPLAHPLHARSWPTRFPGYVMWAMGHRAKPVLPEE